MLSSIAGAAGRPLQKLLTVEQRNDYVVAWALPDFLPPTEHMLANRECDVDCYHEAFKDKGEYPVPKDPQGLDPP